MAEIRQHSQCKIIFVCENNLGFEAGHLHDFLIRHFKEFYSVHELREGINLTGFKTTPGRKKEYVRIIRSRLLRESIFFLDEENLVCTNPFKHLTQIEKRKDIMKRLEEQLRWFKESVSDGKKRTIQYTGKVDAQGKKYIFIFLKSNVKLTNFLFFFYEKVMMIQLKEMIF